MELPAVKTHATPEDVRDALIEAWWAQLGSAPSKESISILMAQWAIETAEGSSMICWNIGNIKQPTDDRDYCMFPTFEFVHGLRVELEPPDPGCRFRAFHSLADGVNDYLNAMWSRWVKSWPQVVSGSPRGFVIGLKAQGYFTAPIDIYSVGVMRYFTKYMAMEWPPEKRTTEPDLVAAVACDPLKDA